VGTRKDSPQIAKDSGSPSPVYRWLQQADVEDGIRPAVTAAESAELRELTGGGVTPSVTGTGPMQHLINAARVFHCDDPEFGYQFNLTRLPARGDGYSMDSRMKAAPSCIRTGGPSSVQRVRGSPRRPNPSARRVD
jgi:hypothetical protein